MKPRGLVPNRSGLVQLKFGRLYLRDVGPSEAAEASPPVLLLHDLGLCSHTWSALIPPLATQRRLLAPDLPGAGNSDRPPPDGADGYSLEWMRSVLVGLLDSLELSAVDVVGHGLGAALAAGLPSGRVRRLVLIAPVCFAIEPPFGPPLHLPVLGPLIFPGLLRKSEFRAYVRRQYSTAELMPKSRFDVYWDRISRDGGVEAAYAMADRLADPGDLSDVYRRIHAPTAVVWGDRDRILPVDDAQRSADLVAGAKLVVIDGCGHAPQEERPRALTPIIEGHLAG